MPFEETFTDQDAIRVARRLLKHHHLALERLECARRAGGVSYTTQLARESTRILNPETVWVLETMVERS